MVTNVHYVKKSINFVGKSKNYVRKSVHYVGNCVYFVENFFTLHGKVITICWEVSFMKKFDNYGSYYNPL